MTATRSPTSKRRESPASVMTPTASWPSEWSSVPFWRFLNSVHIGATRTLTTTRSPLAFGMLWSTTSTFPLPVISAVLTVALLSCCGGSLVAQRRASALDGALEEPAHELLPEDQVHDERQCRRERQDSHLGRQLHGRASGELQHPDRERVEVL